MSLPRSNLPDASRWSKGGNGKINPIPSPSMAVAHRKLDERRKQTFLENLEKLGSFNAAAVATDGGSRNTARTFKVALLKDTAFAQQVDAAMSNFADKVHAVVRGHVLDGDLRPVVSGGRIVTDSEGKEVWQRVRDARIILAYLRRWMPEFRDVKTENVNVNVNGATASNSADPEFRVKSSDLWLLDSHKSATLTALLKKVHANRRETMLDITPPPELEEEKLIGDAQYTDETDAEEVDPRYDPKEI